MFWPNPNATVALGAVHRALGLARAALLLDAEWVENADELVEARAFHPHRVPRRRKRASRRPGAVLARPQHCITPLVRPAPCGHTLAGLR
ncbi:MAG TPA: hypothetical protein VID68_12245 [Solirubrobacteraceae bacterium]